MTPVNNKRENMYELSSSLQQGVIPQSTGKVGGEGKRCPSAEKGEGRQEHISEACRRGRAGLASVGGRIHSGPGQEGIEIDSGQAQGQTMPAGPLQLTSCSFVSSLYGLASPPCSSAL